MIWRILCRIGLCLGGVVCDHGKATCNKCGYCNRYGKAHNAPGKPTTATEPITPTNQRKRTMIIKKAQFNYVDVWDDSLPGWDSHTRVQIKKTDHGGKKAFYVAGIPLPKIKLVEIAKSI